MQTVHFLYILSHLINATACILPSVILKFALYILIRIYSLAYFNINFDFPTTVHNHAKVPVEHYYRLDPLLRCILLVL